MNPSDHNYIELLFTYKEYQIWIVGTYLNTY